jgi:hypothetical protein
MGGGGGGGGGAKQPMRSAQMGSSRAVTVTVRFVATGSPLLLHDFLSDFFS